jgi:actin related protein 2/3 complex subunit 1A/1B
VCPQSKEILIFKTNGQKDISKWTLDQTLKHHYALVCGLDWHPVTQKLLSCSSDRAAIVWAADSEGKMLPQMCVTKEKMSNLDVNWNYRGDKFCIGSSSGYVYQATYNSQFSFWVCKDEKRPRHKASVVSVKYDPGSGHAVASASLDGTIQITSCYDKNLDGAHSD